MNFRIGTGLRAAVVGALFLGTLASTGSAEERAIYKELQEISDAARKDREKREKEATKLAEQRRREREEKDKEIQKAVEKKLGVYENELKNIQERAEKYAEKNDLSPKDAEKYVEQVMKEYKQTREQERRRVAEGYRGRDEAGNGVAGREARPWVDGDGRRIPAGANGTYGPWMEMGGVGRGVSGSGSMPGANDREFGNQNSSFGVRATVIRLGGPEED